MALETQGTHEKMVLHFIFIHLRTKISTRDAGRMSGQTVQINPECIEMRVSLVRDRIMFSSVPI